MKKVLDISAFYHDSAKVIWVTSVAAAWEERFTRNKRIVVFLKEAICYGFKEAELTIDELYAIVTLVLFIVVANALNIFDDFISHSKRNLVRW